MGKQIKKILSMLALGLVVMGLYGAVNCNSCLAAVEEETEEEDRYKLTDDVQKWLNEGQGIPSEAKYATLSGSKHLWVIEDSDLSDCKVELSSNDETIILTGYALSDWLKHQMFFGEGYGKDRVKFVRPNKKTAF